ncbi:MAG: M1 family aminopeptidase [Anaerolineae bacterium]
MLLAIVLAGCHVRPPAIAAPQGGATAPAAVATPMPSLPPAASPIAVATPISQPASPTPGVRASPTPTPTVPADACLPLPTAAGRPRYRFTVVADPAAHTLRVRQETAIADEARLAAGEIVFNTPANGVPGVFTLERVRLSSEPPSLAAERPLADLVRLEGAILRVRLPRANQPPPSLTVCLEYTLRLPPAGQEGISAGNALGWAEEGMIAGYWYPVLAPYERGRGWLLVPYHPVGDPIVYEVADYEVAVRAPATYTVIAAGQQSKEADLWRFRLERARGFAFVVTNALVAVQGQADATPVRVFHRPQHADAARAVLRAAGEALPLFARSYGPYPYGELIIVEAAQFGGMEYSALITLSTEWFASYQPVADDKFGADMLVRFAVHEMGHQWWYGAVGNDQAHEPWLDEALARYGELLYYQSLHPEYLAWWAAPSKGMAVLPINQPIYNFADSATYVQAVYVSGSRFLFDVRDELGPAGFAAFLQEYRRRYEDRLATGADLLSLLRGRMGAAALDRLLPIYFK